MDLGKEIRDSIQKTLCKGGWTLIREEWGNEIGKCACGLSCVLVAHDIPIPEDTTIENMTEVLRPILGVDEIWVTDFTLGFDGELPRLKNDEDDDEPFSEAYILGTKIGEELFPEDEEVDDEEIVED